ncbi:hypothetical protein OF83DRAFT_1288084 [Amylostereum chailletii]|nr:hypothetical protein OF83DRAFT_1288084 [Amylostereum chailletii]
MVLHHHINKQLVGFMDLTILPGNPLQTLLSDLSQKNSVTYPTIHSLAVSVKRRLAMVKDAYHIHYLTMKLLRMLLKTYWPPLASSELIMEDIETFHSWSGHANWSEFGQFDIDKRVQSIMEDMLRLTSGSPAHASSSSPPSALGKIIQQSDEYRREVSLQVSSLLIPQPEEGQPPKLPAPTQKHRRGSAMLTECFSHNMMPTPLPISYTSG